VVDKPFIIPGGRFREYYYWDTFWTVEGLLVCEMKNTVRYMIDNFVQLVKNYGFIPNGGRIYYLNRSQPPFLIPIVDLYLAATNDFDFVKGILTSLEAEYDFWNTKRVIEVSVAGTVHRLNQYAANMNTPRPESYYEDVHTAEGMTGKAQADLYQDLASGAESGWDFSSRWLKRSSKSLKSIRTRKIVPVDLNAVLYRNELTLERMYKRAGDAAKAEKFKQLAVKRRLAMEQVFWNERKAAWLDYDLETNSSNLVFYASSVVPLWAGLHHGNVTRDEIVVNALEELKVLDYPGGMPTSLVDSKQQWDFPNSWAPLQYMAQEGMANSANDNIKEIAFQLAQNWILTNYKAWNKTKAMYEKYDARVQDAPGGGGEYGIQIGFGWTNGVALHLLKRYPSRLKLPHPDPPSSKGERVMTGIQVLLVLATCALGLI
jgi:alpha,alpha-trehalase